MGTTLFFAITAFLCLAPTAQADDPPKGFTALFNGKDFSGWHGKGIVSPQKWESEGPAGRKAQLQMSSEFLRKHWKVDNGELVSGGYSLESGTALTSDKEYGDIELLLEYKSGDTKSAATRLHFRSVDFPMGNSNKEWNRVRLVMVGERATLFLNDKLIIDHARQANIFWARVEPTDKHVPLPKSDRIQLTGDESRLRNIFIREIPTSEANEILRAKGSKGFVDVFNGKDLDGWAGPIDQYEVKDGAIVCKPKKGGTIYTKAKYADFVARVEFRLPPGGNNGLAIRYPGQGDTAYVGMCEIQVLDDTAKGYAMLDPRQYNGSAYGMTAAHRGYLRPVGDWNFEEVTVKGSTIKVELNGTLILDTDLSTVTVYMGKSPHPGKTRTEGHFGFAGHNDPVAFRNIQIRVLGKE